MVLKRLSFVPRALAVASIALALSACTDFSKTPDLLGRVTVKVTNDAGAPLSGISVDLLLNDRQTRWRNLLTGADGSGEFDTANGGVIPQTYVVRVLLSGTNFVIAPDDTNDKPVVVVLGQTHNVTFKLTPRVVGPVG